ncbi:uncharacterized protein LOC121384092 isoform X1 [Gigantopelta aegis]|uniref:uncharacterized protein LOC121384092 isoform X1 n=1 Tax=Gigantopelta aegis TaxID=1735272 RepID=UPI001B889CBD|nr:uncharacterized protein LOC121384092 isoform X1 [Gigantopelta aegis]
MLVVSFLIFITGATSLEFEGADQNTIQNLKLQYEELLGRMDKLKKDHDKESGELSGLMQNKLVELEDAVKRLDNLQRDKALIERWIVQHRRAHKIRFGDEANSEPKY